MLRLIRRHRTSCPYTSTRYKRCSCPIHVYGTLRGEYIRKSLDLTNWESAQELIGEWSSAGRIGEAKAKIPNLREAIDKFFDDCRARHLSAVTLKKHEILLKKRLLPYAETHGMMSLKNITVDSLRQFRATWEDSPITGLKNLERLKAFFKFCHLAGWIPKNTAEGVKSPKITQIPTLPFEPEEFQKLLDACDTFWTSGKYKEGNRDRLKAMLLLLRYSGLRISDAVALKKSDVEENYLFLYQQKTGTPVRVPLPPVALEALKRVPPISAEYFFWTGNGKVKSAVADWQRSFRRLCAIAGVKGHLHMLRDTAAIEWLKAGVSIEEVSVLLGHASPMVTLRSYRPWVRSLQERLEKAVQASWAPANFSR